MRLIRFFQKFDFFSIQSHLKGFNRIGKMKRFGGADNRGGDIRLVQHPSQRDLRVGYASFLSKLSDSIDDREIRVLVIEAVGKLVRFSTGGLTFFLPIAISGQKPSG